MPPSGLRLLCLIQTGKFRPLCRDSRLWALLDILPSLGIEPRVGKSHCRKEWRTNTGCVEHLCKSFTVHLNHTAPSFCLQKCVWGWGETRDALPATVPLTNPYLSPAWLTPRSGIIISVHTCAPRALAPSPLREGTCLPVAMSASSVS